MNIVAIEPLGVAKDRVEAIMSGLTSAGHHFTYYETRTTEVKELVERGREADIIIIANLPFSKEVIAGCPNLKMLSVAFTGVDHVDLSACKERGIIVCNSAGYSTNAVAELTFALALSVLRRVVPCDARSRSGDTKDGLVGFELFGKTFGIVGTGAIGLKTAVIARAFGCDVLAYSRSRREEAIQAGIRYVELDTLLKESDIVSLHVPLNDSTKGLLGDEKLALMKKSAVLINTARGPVVDSIALAQALKSGAIAGAGIDVFDTEPPLASDMPLLGAPNTVLTPHVAFASHEALYARAEIVEANIRLWLAGTPQNLV